MSNKLHEYTELISKSSLSSIDKEVISSLQYFIKLQNLSYNLGDVMKFITKDKARKSICHLADDVIIHTCSFLSISDGVMLLRLNKRMTSCYPELWKLYEKIYLEGSTLYGDWKLTRLHIAVDWFEFIVSNDCQLNNLLKHLVYHEIRIVKLSNRNKEIDPRYLPNPTPQTLLEFHTNNMEITENLHSLNKLYINGPLDKISILENYRWACPDGYFHNMPQVDERLYTGIKEREDLEENNIQEDETSDHNIFNYDSESDDSHYDVY